MEKTHQTAVSKATDNYAKRLEFGAEVRIFRDVYGLTLKAIAAASDVKYYSLMDTMCGRIPGPEVVRKVKAYMASVEQSSHEQAVE